MQCSQCSPVSCCPPVTPATRDVLRKCQITKKLSQYVIHVHPPPSQPPGPSQQNTTRRWSWEGCNSSSPALPCRSLPTVGCWSSRPQLSSLLLILWDGSRSECHNSQHRKQPESVHISGEWRETTWLLLTFLFDFLCFINWWQLWQSWQWYGSGRVRYVVTQIQRSNM